MTWARYKQALRISDKVRSGANLKDENIDKGTNVGFRAHDQGIVSYE